MGKRRELFFKEQLFVLQGTDTFNGTDFQLKFEKVCPGKLKEVTSPESISMSMLLGWEEVMPSLASQTSHGDRRNLYAAESDYSERIQEMEEATDSTDTNFAHSSQQSFFAGQAHISNHSLLTLDEAVYVNSNLKQFESPRDAYEKIGIHGNFNVDESTEYGRRLIQVSCGLRAYEQEILARSNSKVTVDWHIE